MTTMTKVASPDALTPQSPSRWRWAWRGSLMWLGLMGAAWGTTALLVEPIDPASIRVIHLALSLAALLALVPWASLAAEREPELSGVARLTVVGGLLAVGLAPFGVIVIWHGVHHPDTWTGFLASDIVYYVANGRAVWERGDGWRYPNPFDTDPNAPVIYFHWVLWLLGTLCVQGGLTPVQAVAGVNLVGALALAGLTWGLVRVVVPAEQRWGRGPCYLITMWGGGVWTLWTFLAPSEALVPTTLVDPSIGLNLGTRSILAGNNDGFNGWFLIHWGRNVVFVTEAVYHALVAGAWLAAATGHWRWTVGLITALGATHPYSGFQHLAALNLFFGLTFLLGGRRGRAWLKTRWATVLTASLALGGFAWYYAGYLPSFAAHRALQSQLSLNWTLGWDRLAASAGPAALLALARLIVEGVRRLRDPERPWSLGPREGLWLTTAMVSVLLCKHEVLLETPKQPIHFDRGYIATPLLLVGLPLLGPALSWTARRTPAVLSCAVVGLAALDTFAWIAGMGRYDTVGMTLDARERAVIAEVVAWRPEGVILFERLNHGLFAAAHGPIRPYAAHWHTPDRLKREAQVANLTRQAESLEVLDEVQGLVLSSPTAATLSRILELRGFQRRTVIEPWEVWQRDASARPPVNRR